MSKLQKKILLTLLKRHEDHSYNEWHKAMSVTELSLMIYPKQKKTRDQIIHNTALHMAELKEKGHPELSSFVEYNITNWLRKSRTQAWPDFSPTVSIRRALESLRKQGLLVKNRYHKPKDERDYQLWYQSKHWNVTLTDEGIKTAKEIREEIRDFMSEWFEYVTAIEKTEQPKELEAEKE